MKTLKVIFRYRVVGSASTKILEELIDVEEDSTSSEIEQQLKEHRNSLIRQTPNVIFQDGFTYANANFLIDDKKMKYTALKNFLETSHDIITVRNIALDLMNENSYETVYNDYKTKINQL